MNILKIGDIEIKTTGDMLKDIFTMQHELQERYCIVERKKRCYYPESICIDEPSDQNFIKSMAFRCITEIIEATECMRNKPWKQTHVVTDVEHMKEEIADALHFFVELCLLLGMSAEDLYTYYMKKNKVNDWRIDSKY
jgi:dimeric dUTPase (all-alpha-NTP-PPase superfamily)